MNAVEIEQAITDLAELSFDPATFPYAFLEAFGNKETTIKRLRAGASNKSDLGGVLQTNNIHILTCDKGAVSKTLKALKESPATTRAKAKFILATDGADFEAEDIASGETVACAFTDFPDHFGFFLPLAGITTVRQISENAFDIRATSRLNRLYVELLRDNPDWGKAERRHDMNHFMARLIFCFFAEDTDIFVGRGKFTDTVAQMSAKDSSNTHEVIGTLFLAMNTKRDERATARIPRWADDFPYVNGGLFSGNMDVPKFSKIARSYLLHVGGLDWTKINPDIFGSMIQAVAEGGQRGDPVMHYTTVPRTREVVPRHDLDEGRARLAEAGENPRTLLNLRRRMAKIRIFDPACGSGNFLVIAYKAMREIEAKINRRRGEHDRSSEIPLTNFRGIELRDFPAEIARLALVIAQFQCDVLYRGRKLALAEFLPLRNENWITRGNALHLDWLSICPPTGTGVKLKADDLFKTPLDQAQIDFENEGGETYICGNPPFSGTRKQTEEQKADLEAVFSKITSKWKNVDYVGAWLLKAALYNKHCNARFAFVATNSLCQGQQVPITWSILTEMGCRIRFAHSSFIWSNLAANRAGVTVIIIGLDFDDAGPRMIITGDSSRTVEHINPYLTEHHIKIVEASRRPLFLEPVMDYGVYYSKSAGLILDSVSREALLREGFPVNFIKSFLGSTEFINGESRYCLWLSDEDVAAARRFPSVASRIDAVRRDRLATEDKAVNKLAARPHQFRERKGDEAAKIFVPIVSSENREYFPVGLVDGSVIPTNKSFYMGNCPLWCLR